MTQPCLGGRSRSGSKILQAQLMRAASLRMLAFSVALVAVITAVHQAYETHYDFGVFYYAARMVWEGHRTSLYDLATQYAFQARYGRPQDSIFCSPAFMLAPFLLLSLMPMWAAFLLWMITSVALLALVVRRLGISSGEYGDWPWLLSMSFMPVVHCLSHGQLSILVLGAYASCYELWRRGKRFSGGLILAIAMVKFQLIAGFVAVLCLKKKWRELGGVATGSGIALLVSLAITGWHGLLRYPALLWAEEHSPGVLPPERMASLRGLLAVITGHPNPLLLAAVLSVMVIFVAAWIWKEDDLAVGFSAALIASLLAAYHVNQYDLTLLLLPAFLVMKALPSRSVVLLGLTAYGLPLLFWVTGYFALFAIPLTLALAALALKNRGNPVCAFGCD
jgi:hypothetical protein